MIFELSKFKGFSLGEDIGQNALRRWFPRSTQPRTHPHHEPYAPS